MSNEKQIKAGIRIDGGRRTDLKLYRERRAAESKRPKPPVEDTRVSDAWAREEARVDVSKRRTAEKKRMRGLSNGGAEGSQIVAQGVKISGARSTNRPMRCRPGTFEWRYGRNRQDVYFHAGNHFALLWERAGVAIASPMDFLRGIKSGYATGISDGRVAAIDALAGAVEKMGHAGFERLMLYCVQGVAASEIGKREGQNAREAAIILHNDLRQCAIHFRLLGKSRGVNRSGGEPI